MNTIRFLSYIILMALLGASGLAFREAFTAAEKEAAFGCSVAVFAHIAAGCIMTAIFWEGLRSHKDQ